MGKGGWWSIGSWSLMIGQKRWSAAAAAVPWLTRHRERGRTQGGVVGRRRDVSLCSQTGFSAVERSAFRRANDKGAMTSSIAKGEKKKKLKLKLTMMMMQLTHHASISRSKLFIYIVRSVKNIRCQILWIFLRNSNFYEWRRSRSDFLKRKMSDE